MHAVVRDRPEIRSKLDESKTQFDTRPLSVLMIGIDSISRLNLIRAMPKTAQHLYDTGWFEMRGYNKVSTEFITSRFFYLYISLFSNSL